ncbi:hypothetical protein GCM10007973_27140 [Polymorphobacter multimanifer]|uniref:DUF4403 family protein n=1 Tax=Polymorphobacter multimanifer TaxID=1070431 RepID=UPI001663661D|nr:DUF4403 family protein [Polymorphobacter multimanifer]GGI89320.1 hypothetical protein GCM10007973_27140 [Polymorphobacter multimanifer]
MRSIFFALLLLVAACSRDSGNPAPPRDDTPLPIPTLTSTIAVPVTGSLDDLQAAINRDTPETLWSIDERVAKCIPGARVSIKVLGVDRARVTPDIPCHVTGNAVRGPVTVGGSGDVLTLSMPVTASVTARDAGQKIIRKTATAEALVTAKVRLGLTPDWQPQARVDLDYRWLREPGVDLLGQRLNLTGRADPKLQRVIAKLEADIPRQLARAHTRETLAENWAQAFTTIELNRRNPEVWLRVAPEAVHVDPWRIEGREVVLPLSVRATAETFVGHRPDDPAPTPLPAPSPAMGGEGVLLHLPVIADYVALEPVLARALERLSRKGIKVADYGVVDVKFGKVTRYPTSRGRVAVGLQIDAKSPRQLVHAKGTLWLAGTPYNAAGSQRVAFKDLEVASSTDSPGFDLLVAITEEPLVKASIADALTQDFSKDLAKLMAKIEPKLAALPIGRAFTLRATITDFRNGQVSALGQGLFMPVDAQATAAVSYRPPGSGRERGADRAPAGSASDRPSKRPAARP